MCMERGKIACLGDWTRLDSGKIKPYTHTQQNGEFGPSEARSEKHVQTQTRTKRERERELENDKRQTVDRHRGQKEAKEVRRHGMRMGRRYERPVGLGLALRCGHAWLRSIPIDSNGSRASCLPLHLALLSNRPPTSGPQQITPPPPPLIGCRSLLAYLGFRAIAC